MPEADIVLTPIERLWGRILKAGYKPAGDCLQDEDMIELVEMKGKARRADPRFDHAALCPICSPIFLELCRVNELGRQAGIIKD